MRKVANFLDGLLDVFQLGGPLRCWEGGFLPLLFLWLLFVVFLLDWLAFGIQGLRLRVLANRVV